MFKCRICGLTFLELPPNAVRISVSKSHYQMFRFSDGSVHSIRRIQHTAKKEIAPGRATGGDPRGIREDTKPEPKQKFPSLVEGCNQIQKQK